MTPCGAKGAPEMSGEASVAVGGALGASGQSRQAAAGPGQAGPQEAASELWVAEESQASCLSSLPSTSPGASRGWTRDLLLPDTPQLREDRRRHPPAKDGSPRAETAHGDRLAGHRSPLTARRGSERGRHLTPPDCGELAGSQQAGASTQ